MSLKKSIVIDDRRCICKSCSKSHTCEVYIKYAKMLDMLENLPPSEYMITMTSHIRKCNQYIKEK